MPRAPGVMVRMRARNDPVPPPTSAIVRERREVVDGDGVTLLVRERGHRPIEQRALLGARRAVRPDVLAVEVLEGVGAGAHAVLEIAPCLPEER